MVVVGKIIAALVFLILTSTSSAGSDTIRVEAKFTLRGFLDIAQMMEDAGYTNRGEFLAAMERAAGRYDWDRDVDKDSVFEVEPPPGWVLKTESFPEEETGPTIEIEPTPMPTVTQQEYDKLKEELEALKERHKKHEQPSYLMGPEYTPAYGQTIDRIVERGNVICGTYNETPGFSDKIGDWEGFDVDICTAVAIAIFGEPNIEFIAINGKTRFERLFDGTIDILSATTTWTYSREVDWKIEFMPTTYYDGQGFMVRKSLGVKSAKDLTGARVCYGESSTAAQNIKDFFELWQVQYKPVPVPASDEVFKYYIDGDCDMYGTDRSALAGRKSTFSDPENHVILPEIISKEPLGPAVKYGDSKFSAIVRWTIYSLLLAEELGITQDNIGDFLEHSNPTIQRFMGERNGDQPGSDNLGVKLGLQRYWSVNIIEQLGNYGEIFERHIGKNTPLGLDRGVNRLYTNGGVLYAPPLK